MYGDGMTTRSTLKLSMIESYPPDLGQGLGLAGLTYEDAFNVLKKTNMVLLYESNTGVLTSKQRQLFENILEKVPSEIKAFLDPLIVSFAVHDACDSSDTKYLWLDFTEGDNISSSAWVEHGRDEEVLKRTVELLEKNLEKYVIDAYDRQAREGITSIWSAELAIPECWYCGTRGSMVKKIIAVNDKRVRGWTCNKCGHSMILPQDILENLKKG